MQYKKQDVLTTECRRKKQKQWSENLPVLSLLSAILIQRYHVAIFGTNFKKAILYFC